MKDEDRTLPRKEPTPALCRRVRRREHHWVFLSMPTFFGSIGAGYRCSICGLQVYYTGVFNDCPGPRILTTLSAARAP